MSDLIAGDYFLLKQGTPVWSVSLLSQITFTIDRYFKVTSYIPSHFWGEEGVFAYAVRPSFDEPCENKFNEIYVGVDYIEKITVPKLEFNFNWKVIIDK